MKVNISFTNPTYEIEPNDISFESDKIKMWIVITLICGRNLICNRNLPILTFLVSS